jgi:hypothetical protein
MIDPSDRVRASVLVRVEPTEAFRVFTQELDRWWRRGPRYRVARAGEGELVLEPGVGGRLVERVPTQGGQGGERVVPFGVVTRWEPPALLALEWRAVHFRPEETTWVEVTFVPHPAGTWVTVTHGGWSAIRPDHPVRHGQETAAFLRGMGMWWGDLLTALRRHAA